MNFEKVFSESVDYTKETFIGHWNRWMIFILLGLPFALVPFVFDPIKNIDPKAADITALFTAIRWDFLAVLLILGILASFFIAGYTVRIYRGIKPAPDFNEWAALFMDGIRVDIVMLVWLLPAVILSLLSLLLLFWGMLSSPMPNWGILVLVPVLLLIVFILLIIAAFYATMGAIRFSRTGSMSEGWSFSAISATIRKIGWGSYIVALIIFFFIALFFNLVVSIPALIPYIGWLVPVCLAPLLTVFTARYFTLVYESGETPPPETRPTAP